MSRLDKRECPAFTFAIKIVLGRRPSCSAHAVAGAPLKRVDRRLTAILAADVVGYSRLMSTDQQSILLPGERCAVPPKTAHYVHGEADGACKFLIVQGVGVYDFVAVGG